jgi:hypothetical protein
MNWKGSPRSIARVSTQIPSNQRKHGYFNTIEHYTLNSLCIHCSSLYISFLTTGGSIYKLQKGSLSLLGLAVGPSNRLARQQEPIMIEILWGSKGVMCATITIYKAAHGMMDVTRISDLIDILSTSCKDNHDTLGLKASCESLRVFCWLSQSIHEGPSLIQLYWSHAPT